MRGAEKSKKQEEEAKKKKKRKRLGGAASACECVCEDWIISARLTLDLPPAVVYAQPSA